LEEIAIRSSDTSETKHIIPVNIYIYANFILLIHEEKRDDVGPQIEFLNQHPNSSTMELKTHIWWKLLCHVARCFFFAPFFPPSDNITFPSVMDLKYDLKHVTKHWGQTSISQEQ